MSRKYAAGYRDSGKRPMTRDEQREAVARLRAGDTSGATDLIDSAIRLGLWMAKRHVKARPWDEAEIIQVVMLAIAESVATFDPERSPFQAYVRYRVGQQLTWYRRRSRVVTAPLSDARFQTYTVRPLSMDRTDAEGQTMHDFLASEQPANDPVLAKTVARALEGLPWRERLIVTRTVMGDETLQSVASDLGVTRERVRQVQEAALDKLRKRLARVGREAA